MRRSRQPVWALSLLLAIVALSIHGSSASAESVATIVTMNGPAEIEKDGSTVVGVITSANTTVIVAIDATQADSASTPAVWRDSRISRLPQ